MAHTRPMYAGHALGVRESQFSVFSGSSSAEDLLASLDDFPLVAPQPYVLLDGGRIPSPLLEEKEDVVYELQHSELPIPREHVQLSNERDYLDRERLSPAQEELGRTLVNPSRALRPNVVMDHCDPDTNTHTFKIAYPSHGRSEQEHYGSPERPTACASPRTTASTPSISSPLTPTHLSGSSSSSVSVACERVRASTLPTSTASAYYVGRSAPPSAGSSPSLIQAAPPFVRRKISSPVDRLQRPPPDTSLPLAPTRSPPVSRPPSVDGIARRRQAYHATEIEHVHDLDRHHPPSAGAGSRPTRLMSADELGAYREFLTRRAEDCIQDARSFSPPSLVPPNLVGRGDDTASDFSWDAQSRTPSFRSGGGPPPRSHNTPSSAPPMSPAYPRSKVAHPISPQGGRHAAVQEDLMQALQAVRKQEDEGRDVRTILEEEHFARKVPPVRAPPHVRPPSAPRAHSASSWTDPLSSPTQTVLSSLVDDEEAMRDLLPDFLDLGVDADAPHALPTSSGNRNMMWMSDEGRMLSSVPEGAAAPLRPLRSDRALYDDGDSSGWLDDDDYELADPILAPTPVPGSRPRKAHSQPDLTHPPSFLHPPLMKSHSHAGSSSVNSHSLGSEFESDINVDPRHHGRVPLHLDTTAIPSGSRYPRRSPLERLQEDIAQIDPRDAPGYRSPTSPPRRPHDGPAHEVLYDREGRAYMPRRMPRSQPDYDIAYQDEDGNRIVYERADPSFERRCDDFPDTAERYTVRDRPPYSAREYTMRREHDHSSLPREIGGGSGSGTPVSREPPHPDDERAPPARPYHPGPRPAARSRAHSGASQREYVLYDDREYLEYRARGDVDAFSPRQSQQSDAPMEYPPSRSSGDFSPRGAYRERDVPPPERRAPPRSATLETGMRPNEDLNASPARTSPPSQSSSETKSTPAPASTHQPAQSTSSFSTDASEPKAKSSDASLEKAKSRAATPAPRPAPRAYSPDMMMNLAASPMGFSVVSFRQARPKPKPKAKKSGPAGALHAAGVSEPNFKKSSFSVSEEEVKSPRRGLFGKRKKT